MLASLLPGVREVRAPLIAGYLWLLGLWIGFEPAIHDEPVRNDLFGSLDRLGSLLTPVAVGAAVSVAAYLLGALINDATQSAVRWFVVRPTAAAPEVARLTGGLSHRSMESLALVCREQADAAKRRIGTRLSRLPAELFGDPDIHLVEPEDRSVHRLRFELERRTVEELPLVATRLMTESPELFATADRLRSESELRLAVAFALPVVLIAAAAHSSGWWLAGLIAGVPLMVQGMLRARAANDVLVDALFIGKVEAPAAERLRRAVEEVAAMPRRRVSRAMPAIADALGRMS